ALKVGSQRNSQIVLGDTFGQAQYLLGRGDMLVGDGSSVERLQGALPDISLLSGDFWRPSD
ncbi:MAG: hypothetical protein GX256_05325, partial [Fretibacterium sp.]|nr:hypothetical protein [Fretibacterium sp.]